MAMLTTNNNLQNYKSMPPQLQEKLYHPWRLLFVRVSMAAQEASARLRRSSAASPHGRRIVAPPTRSRPPRSPTDQSRCFPTGVGTTRAGFLQTPATTTSPVPPWPRLGAEPSKVVQPMMLQDPRRALYRHSQPPCTSYSVSRAVPGPYGLAAYRPAFSPVHHAAPR